MERDMTAGIHTSHVADRGWGASFFVLDSDRPESWKIRSTLFWDLEFEIGTILKNYGDSQNKRKTEKNQGQDE